MRSRRQQLAFAATAALLLLGAVLPARADPQLVPFYRLVHSSAGIADHLYTTSEFEKSSAESDPVRPYTFERIEGYVSSAAFTGGVPLYRVFHPILVNHYYTIDAVDRDSKIVAGYVDQGTAGYVYSTYELGTVPLARLEQTVGPSDHVLALRISEYSALLNGDLGPGWVVDGTAGFVSPLGLRTAVAHRRNQGVFAGVDGCPSSLIKIWPTQLFGARASNDGAVLRPAESRRAHPFLAVRSARSPGAAVS